MTDEATKTKEKPAKAAKAALYYEAVGRRKNASARARLHVVKGDSVTIKSAVLKKGDMTINERPVDVYFPGEVAKKKYLEPFRTTNTIGRFAITIRVTGGGLNGQLGATIHAVSRALVKVDKEKFRPILKKRGLLTRDPRKRERRKAGLAHSARAKKQSPKR